MADCLDISRGETDAAKYLYQEASKLSGTNTGFILDTEIDKAKMLATNGQMLEALELLQATLPFAKAYDANRCFQAMTFIVTVSTELGRSQEAYDAITDLMAFSKTTYGPNDPETLVVLGLCAVTYATFGRVDEAKAMFEDLLPKQTRIYGRDHLLTQNTLQAMYHFGFATPGT